VNEDGLKLTAYFGERDRAGGRFLADALIDVYARHRLETSLVLRGAEGFGAKHGLRTDRLLTLSEDLPLVAVAVDARPRIEAALADVRALRRGGLVTVERARIVSGPLGAVTLPGEEAKLTVYLGRREGYAAVVALLHRHGLAGATVLLGVDGTVHGRRERARLLATNARVPVMVISVGESERIARVLPELGALVERPLLTLERVRVCKRDGVSLAEPQFAPGMRAKLMVYAGEQSRHAGRPLAPELLRALRRAGAAGATVLRGVWGYHGDHAPHGDSLWQLRRHVPTVVVVVDAPEPMREWFAIVDAHTDETGLVTSELIPATGGQATEGSSEREGPGSPSG
jgi:PII-like signaling protein